MCTGSVQNVDVQNETLRLHIRRIVNPLRNTEEVIEQIQNTWFVSENLQICSSIIIAQH